MSNNYSAHMLYWTCENTNEILTIKTASEISKIQLRKILQSINKTNNLTGFLAEPKFNSIPGTLKGI